MQKSFKANQLNAECVNCDRLDHKPADSEKVKSFPDRKKILIEERLCFNWAGIKHCAGSNPNCLLCKCKHYTSICEKLLSQY